MSLAEVDLVRLTPTGWSILGFLSLQDRNGYEIRQAARRSVEHFWGVSDGQLYPQLRNLADLGLIAAVDGSRGAAQTWRLTDAGRAALHAWLRAPSAPARSRDENLVKLLFADDLGRDAVVALVRERRAAFVQLRAQLATIEPGAHRGRTDEADGRVGPRLVRDYGLSYVDAVVEWCDRAVGDVG